MEAEALLKFIEDRLKKIHKPDPEMVKKHNAEPLNKDWQIEEGELWEQSDVVHDILAFLADKNGKKGIEALTGKSKIKNYLGDYQKGEKHLTFEEFWQTLEKNKNKISANMKSRDLYETIKQEYEKSLSRLLPLKEKLRKTDYLIDQIVYKLYGLSEEEIKIVEDFGRDS